MSPQPNAARYEVVVVRGGPTRIMAAADSTRQGHSTLVDPGGFATDGTEYVDDDDARELGCEIDDD